MFNLILSLAVILFCTDSVSANNFRVLTLNLHGYHPTNEKERWLEYRSGHTERGSSFLYYFNESELVRGQSKRLELLANDIDDLKPDLVFLQEVGAGGPRGSRDCQAFHRNYVFQPEDDHHEVNAAIRLRQRLNQRGNQYRLRVACRGNVGWITDQKKFRDFRIVTFSNNSQHYSKQIVFDFDSNPYPNGLLVEGLGLLVSPRFNIYDHRAVHLNIPNTSETVFFQLTTIKNSTSWIVLVNLHMGHKLRNFEQAVYIRNYVEKYISELKRNNSKMTYVHQVYAGDFNARLYRPNVSDVSERGGPAMIPWELDVPGQFRYRSASRQSIEYLSYILFQFNFDRNYKHWATIPSKQEAGERAYRASEFFLQQQHTWGELRDGLNIANERGVCNPNQRYQASCHIPQRIDFSMASSKLKVKGAQIIYSQNNWHRLDTLTDHPGVIIDYFIQE